MISVAFFKSYVDELRLIQMTMGEEPKKSLKPRNCLTLNSCLALSIVGWTSKGTKRKTHDVPKCTQDEQYKNNAY